jgi:hypothetical protein
MRPLSKLDQFVDSEHGPCLDGRLSSFSLVPEEHRTEARRMVADAGALDSDLAHGLCLFRFVKRYVSPGNSASGFALKISYMASALAAPKSRLCGKNVGKWPLMASRSLLPTHRKAEKPKSPATGKRSVGLGDITPARRISVRGAC